MPRILYGLESLPRDPDNPRLPAVTAGPAMLRLNSLPLPADMAPEEPSHAARVSALRDWLLRQCGDYAGDRRRFVEAYLHWVVAALAAARADIAATIVRFDGIYAPQDFFWSAPRPLPRAWLNHEGEWRRFDMLFWDGARALEVDCALPPDMQMPRPLQRFWEGEALPKSPFRRPVEWPD